MIASAPAARAAAARSGREMPARTRAPIARASCTAAWPTPPAAPSTSTVSPGVQPRPAAQGHPRGVVNDAHRGGAREGQVLRQAVALIGFAASTASPYPPYSAVASTRSPTASDVTPGPTADDDAGRALAGDEGQRRHELIDAADHEHIDIIDRRGMDLDEDLARAGHRSGRVADAQRLGRAELFDDDGSHPLVLSGRRAGKRTGSGRQAALRNPLDQLSFDDLAARASAASDPMQHEFRHLEAGQAEPRRDGAEIARGRAGPRRASRRQDRPARRAADRQPETPPPSPARHGAAPAPRSAPG